MPILGYPVCEWLSWLSAFQCCQMMPLIGSQGCEWLLCLGAFQASNNACFLLSSLQVAAIPHCFSSLLTMPVLALQFVSDFCIFLCSSLLTMPAFDSPGCERLLCLCVQAC